MQTLAAPARKSKVSEFIASFWLNRASKCSPSAIHRQCRACDERRLIRREEQSRAGNFVRLTRARQHRFGDLPPVQLAAIGWRNPRADRAGADRICADALWTEIEGCTAREA